MMGTEKEECLAFKQQNYYNRGVGRKVEVDHFVKINSLTY